MDYVLSTDIKSNQVNDVIVNEPKCNFFNSVANTPLRCPLPIMNLILRDSKKYIQTLN